MKEYTLPTKTLFLWQIRIVIVSILLWLILEASNLDYRYIIVGLAALTVFVAFLYLPFYFKSFKIRFINGAVVIDNGIIIKNTHILPFSRLIYTQTLISPLARLFGIKAISLKAARSRIFVPEMKKDDIDELLLYLAEVKDDEKGI